MRIQTEKRDYSPPKDIRQLFQHSLVCEPHRCEDGTKVVGGGARKDQAALSQLGVRKLCSNFFPSFLSNYPFFRKTLNPLASQR